MYRLVTYGVSALLQEGEVQSTERFRSVRVRSGTSVQVGVSVESDLMKLEILSTEFSQEELLEILGSYKQKRTYHRLRSGDFLALGEDIAQLGELVDGLRLSDDEFIRGEISLPTYRALYLDRMLEKNNDLYAGRDQTFREIVRDFKTVEDSVFEISDTLKGVLRGYQEYGHKWLCTLKHFRFGGILADDMGLGKTLQTISMILSEKESGTIGTSLIVCPSSLVYNWQEEFGRFAPSLAVVPIAGKPTERRELLQHYSDYDVLITSYDLLKRDIEKYEEPIFLFQILDEAQYIKNQAASSAKAVKLVHSRYRFALTGTPIENRLSELWSIFDFLMPGFLYRYDEFRKNFEIPIAKQKDEAVTARLRYMVSPFILRRLKGDVLKDLPEKLEEVHYARFSPEQQQVYDGQVVRIRQMLQADNRSEQDAIRILAELTRIRQICCDPSLLFENYGGGSAKREACMELVRSAIDGGHRILLFSQFTSMLALLAEDLRRAEISFFTITGNTPKQERLSLVKRFIADSTPVFLISLKAGGTGLNLTGADVVIHYDPWWNLAAQNQATDRAHRIGQTKMVTVYKLIIKNSIEEKILQLQETKQDLADAVLSGEHSSLGQMSREELLELLEV